MFSVLNEPFMETIGSFALRSLYVIFCLLLHSSHADRPPICSYLEAYRTVRAASGLGEGHGPVSSVPMLPTASYTMNHSFSFTSRRSSPSTTASRAQRAGTASSPAPTEWPSTRIATSPSASPTSTRWSYKLSSLAPTGQPTSIARWRRSASP